MRTNLRFSPVLVLAFLFAAPLLAAASRASIYPIVINTWPFTDATEKAWETVNQPSNDTHQRAILAIENGCGQCEIEQCDGSVGYGGSPDEKGETTLDAMIMDGTIMDVGAVGALRNIKHAIGVARYVLQYSTHTMLVGSQATEYAISMGFVNESLETPGSIQAWQNWQSNKCQPNYRQDVTPSPTSSCGPYSPNPIPRSSLAGTGDRPPLRDHLLRAEPPAPHVQPSHDTIAMVVIDPSGDHIISGTSTNGLSHKIPGRVGDSPIAGAGSYADSEVGGCGATGDGDVMMRFLPCYQAVENLRQGMTPTAAAQDALGRIVRKYQNFQGALFVINKDGEHGGASHNWTFVYSMRTPSSGGVVTYTVPPLEFPKDFAPRVRAKRANSK